MSDGASSDARSPSDSATSLESEAQLAELAPRRTDFVGRRPRFGTGGPPLSPFIWVDGKVMRSALAIQKKWPPRRVSFPMSDSHLVTGYLEPANPWEHAKNVNSEELISMYKNSCMRHETDPLECVVSQLKKLDITDERHGELCLKGQHLGQNDCEPLEEIFKRIQFDKIDLEGTSLDDESAKHLSISNNKNIGIRGWQACSSMIKRTECLEQLEASNMILDEKPMNLLNRALRLASHLQILKLENCELSGRSIVILVTALKLSTGLKELYLADNGLMAHDAMQLASLLRINHHLQLLDISNNNIEDLGAEHLIGGFIDQPADGKDGKGLCILILWNNHLTKASARHFSRVLTRSKTLGTLNVGQNVLTDEMMFTIKESLQNNRILLQLGMQATGLTCQGVIALAEIIGANRILQRIDLRDNVIQMTGLSALAAAMKTNRSVTQLDLDDKPRTKIDASLHQYMDMVAEIRGYCLRNEESSSADESVEESESQQEEQQQRSRLSSASSRKISLTCQTLPQSSPPSVPPQVAGEGPAGRSTLEPKRAGGGRLRSPAPSPIPSPVASPIPSPSRGRFLVSRVPEASLGSGNSSASSSLGSSPTRFFPSSRFRVTVVEAVESEPEPEPRPVVASAGANVTVGFDFDPEPADPGAVLVPELAVEPGMPGPGGSEEPAPGRGVENGVVSVREVTVSVRKTGNRCAILGITEVEGSGEKTEKKASDGLGGGTREGPPTAGDGAVRLDAEVRGGAALKSAADEARGQPATVANDSSRKTSTVHRQASGLERLLGLFQNPGNLFSGASTQEKTDSRNNPQAGACGTTVALGDRFQQYLREGRAAACGRPSSGERTPQHLLQRSASDAPRPAEKFDPVKSISVPQFSSIQALTSVFAACKLDTISKHLDSRHSAEEHLERASCVAGCRPGEAGCGDGDATSVKSAWSRGMRLLENGGLRGGEERAIGMDLVQDNPSTVDRPTTTAGAQEPKSSLCAFKLTDIPEYLVLEVGGNPATAGATSCDIEATDSINPTSDKDSSSRSLPGDARTTRCGRSPGVREADRGLAARGAPDVPGPRPSLVAEDPDPCQASRLAVHDQCPRPASGRGEDRKSTTLDEDLPVVALADIPTIDLRETTAAARFDPIDESPNSRGQGLRETRPSDDGDDASPGSRTRRGLPVEIEVENSEKTSELDKSDQDDLIFNMTDISMDAAFPLDEAAALGTDPGRVEVPESPETVFGERARQRQASRSPTSLFIEKSRNVHRNSHDSGIEEAGASMSDEYVAENVAQPRESFQESVDSGIDSECSSVSAKADSVQDISRDRLIGADPEVDLGDVAIDERAGCCTLARTTTATTCECGDRARVEVARITEPASIARSSSPE
ncbi:uncharacterized protein LOC105699773 isoform X2 [Orussus abietinus]|uniref:uncharacterized protein LOC105699773 isoform X2 n=1 Tax=Orussus abietinus TaxID=222816 RepID=UPI000625EA5C|nr:uncharacterized protein LOC105699773 isoform X2 [Orussus abietinus]